MTAPDISVVVASVNGFPYLGECLRSLAERCPQAEVVVADCTDDATRDRVRNEWPDVMLLSFEEPTPIPALRAAGIAAATAPHVALIEDHCVVRNGWSERLLEGHRAGHSVVGGTVRNGATSRLRDWAAFLFEYSAFLEGLPSGPAPALVGMNVSYDRRALAVIDDLLATGRWENWLHERLRARGFVLYLDGDAVLDHVKDFGIREFVAQRFHYSRAYAGMRNPELGGAGRRALYALASPALVPLLYWRVARNVFGRRRYRSQFLLATPLIAVYVVTSAVGEAVGYLLGGGSSLLRIR
jgi:glycosyltransferase involved in cell wall biosynthesis